MGPADWSTFQGCIADPNQPANIKCVEALFSNIISILVSLIGVALFVMLMYGGFTYLTAGADAEKATKAQQIMFWAVMGIVLMILSYIILRAIQWFTGIDVTQFVIPYFDPPTGP